MIVTSESIKTLSAALLRFQGAVSGVGKSSVNPGYKSKYANLETVVDTARPVLQEVGIVFLQSGGAIVEGIMAMTTRLIHAESGEWIEGTMDIALGKRDPQGVGSAQTYAQRYHLMAMLGLPPVDDDGEGAIDRSNSRPVAEFSAPTRTEPAPQLVKVSRESEKALRVEIDACRTAEELKALWNNRVFQAEFEKLHETYRQGMIETFNERYKWLKDNPATIPPNFDNLQP